MISAIKNNVCLIAIAAIVGVMSGCGNKNPSSSTGGGQSLAAAWAGEFVNSCGRELCTLSIDSLGAFTITETVSGTDSLYDTVTDPEDITDTLILFVGLDTLQNATRRQSGVLSIGLATDGSIIMRINGDAAIYDFFVEGAALFLAHKSGPNFFWCGKDEYQFSRMP